jgi:hypothetical protein
MELLTRKALDKSMHKIVMVVAASLVAAGAALAQEGASSSTYFLDVDPARYAGPAGQRLVVQLGDQPRHIALNGEDEICVQLMPAGGDTHVIAAHVRVLRPQPQAAVVRVVAPDISPGTFRSTPWGMLLRVVPDKAAVGNGMVKTVGTSNAPVCSLGEQFATTVSPAVQRQ